MSEAEIVVRTQKIFVEHNTPLSVEVLSRTQRIVVDANNAVSVINAGPVGPPGVNGLPGTAAGRRWYGEGPPGTIVGAAPNDEYVDELTGDLYVLQ